MAFTAIDDPEEHFNTVLYTGNDTSQAISGVGFSPGLLFTSGRSISGVGRTIHDAVRGDAKQLNPNSTAAESDTPAGVTSLDSDGFTVGGENSVNDNAATYVSHSWKMGTTSGISGTGNLTVNGYSFNSTAKQSVIVYTGNGGSSGTYTHGLGSVPGFIFGKNRDEAGDGWFAYHRKNTAAPETDYLVINTNAATADSDGYWNDTAPTSTLVTVGSAGEVNRAEQQVAYCFADVQGYSKFSSYIGNGNADGPFVYTGFKPAYILLKNTGAAEDWWLMDNKREGFNSSVSNRGNFAVQPNSTSAENTNSQADILSNGFKFRATSAEVNSSGVTYIYAAFAEAPFVNSNGVPCTAR